MKAARNVSNGHKIVHTVTYYITYCYILHYILLHTTLHTVTYYITYCIPTYCSQYLRNWDVKKMIETERIKFLSSKLKHFEQLVNALGNRPQKYPE
jgi:hypothetical protein